MSKEDYDNFIKEREENIKNGNLDLIELNKKENEIDNKSDIIKPKEEEIIKNIPYNEKEKINLREKQNQQNKNREKNKQIKQPKNNINKSPQNNKNIQENEIKEEIPKKDLKKTENKKSKEEEIEKELKKSENKKLKEEEIENQINNPENKKKDSKHQNLEIETQTIKNTIEQKEKDNRQSIPVSSTQQSNIPSISQDINTLKSKEKNEDDISENEINKTSDYQFEEDELEAYNEIFEGIGKFLKLINGRNVLNDFINYDDKKYKLMLGFQQLIILCKSSPFNALTINYYM